MIIEELETIATKLLTPLWRGLESDYKRRYAVKIWQQFESNIRSASYTNDVSRFMQRITLRLPISVRDADISELTKFIASCNSREVLRALREHTALLVLLVREANDERREAKASALFENILNSSKEEL